MSFWWLKGDLIFGWLREDEGLLVLCCWVKGGQADLKIQWRCLFASQILDSTESIKSFREGNKCLIVHRGSNRSSWFLEVAKYAGGWSKGLVVIPEGQEVWGWKYFAAELGKMVALFGSSLGKGSNAVLLCHHYSGSPPLGEGGGRNIFAEVVGKKFVALVMAVHAPHVPLGISKLVLLLTAVSDPLA